MLFGDAVPANTFDKVYCYDTFGHVTEVNAPYAFNAFTATSSDSLSAVQFWTEADNASYDVRVYSTYSGGHLSGLLASTTGTETYGGYHTVDLPSSVSLTADQHFYVYLGITNGGDFPMAIDRAYSGYSSSTANVGQSYYSFNGTSWTDLTTYNSTANFCIKALTSSSDSTGSHAPDGLDQQRLGQRGQLGLDQVQLHRDALVGQRRCGHRVLPHGGRHGHCRQRLYGQSPADRSPSPPARSRRPSPYWSKARDSTRPPRPSRWT